MNWATPEQVVAWYAWHRERSRLLRENGWDELAGRVRARAQAEKVDLRFGTWEAPTDEVDEYGDPVGGEFFHLARVVNSSPRPIRQVSCRLSKRQSEAAEPAVKVGKYMQYSISGARGPVLEPGDIAGGEGWFAAGSA